MTLKEPNEQQNLRDWINEICTMRVHYLEEGDSAPPPHLRKFSPLLDIQLIESLSEAERAGMDARTPMLSFFLQSECDAIVERERMAVNAHLTKGSIPPWFVDGQGPGPPWLDNEPEAERLKTFKYGYCDDCTKPILSGINCCCEGARVRISEAQRRKQKLSTRRAQGRREEHVGSDKQKSNTRRARERREEHVGSDKQKSNTRRARERREEHVSSDVTRIPSEAGNANQSSILNVEQSNSFAALEEMVDDAEAESSASVTYTCDKAHCTGGHFQGKHAKREYARHIEIKHRGNLSESESKLGLLQCKICSKIFDMGEKAAKKHQDSCAAQTPEVQAKRRKAIEKSSSVGAAATNKQRKGQPHFS